MKRYALVRFAVVAILSMWLGLDCAEAAKRRKQTTASMTCKQEEDPVWYRNACHDGFLAVISDRRVVTVNHGVDQHDDLVEFTKESCSDATSGPWATLIMTRLYSRSQQRYVCFNARGRLKSVTPRRANRMGRLCAFYERAVPSESHSRYSSDPNVPSIFFNLQSAYNPKWYMGFGPDTPKARKLIGLRLSREGHSLALPRRMGPSLHHKLVRPGKKCDFQFATGTFQPLVHAVPKFNLFGGTVTPEARRHWDGLREHVEASHGFEVINQKNDVRSDSRHRAFSATNKQLDVQQQPRKLLSQQQRRRKNNNSKFRISYAEDQKKSAEDYFLP